MTNYCKGCYSWGKRAEDELPEPRCALSNEFGKCPCTRCVVKTMCYNECQDFVDFRPHTGGLIL